MKKRYLFLASALLFTQIMSVMPVVAANTDAEEVIVDNIDEDDDIEILEDLDDVLYDEDMEDLEIIEDEMDDAEILIDDEMLGEDEDLEYEEEDLEEMPEEEVIPRPVYDFHEYLTALGEYKGQTVEVSPKEEITDDMIQDEIQYRMEMEDLSEQITEGTVEYGDVANIDYVGKKDGVAFDGGTAEGQNLEIGSGTFIEGFEDGLVGVAVGETVDLNLTFPAEYHAEELAGAEVVFTVTVNYIERTPEFSDEIAEQLSEGNCKDVASYKELVKAELEDEAVENQKYEMQNIIWQQLVETTVIDSLPEEVVEYEVQNGLNYYENMLYYYYGVSVDDYLESSGMTMDDFTAEMREEAEYEIRLEIIRLAILEAEGLEITDEEIEEYIAKTAEEYGYELEEFKELISESDVRNSLTYEKVTEVIMNNNTYTEMEA